MPSPVQGSAVNGLITYAGKTVSFDHPASWRMITGGFWARHYEWIEAVLGTGDWHIGCWQTVDSHGDVTSVSCSGDSFVADPGEVVVELYSRDSPAHFIPSPAPGSVVRSDGLTVYSEQAGSRKKWLLFGLPGWELPLTVEAEVGTEPGDSALAQLEAMVDSIRPTHPVGTVVALTTWLADNPPSCDADAALNLARDDGAGFALVNGQVTQRAVWPPGFSGRWAKDGRLELLDATGQVVGEEYDLVVLHARFADDTWSVCSVTGSRP